MNWIDYEVERPKVGQLVLVCRDTELQQIKVIMWSEEDELWSDWKYITHWMPIEYPSKQD